MKWIILSLEWIMRGIKTFVVSQELIHFESFGLKWLIIFIACIFTLLIFDYYG